MTTVWFVLGLIVSVGLIIKFESRKGKDDDDDDHGSCGGVTIEDRGNFGCGSSVDCCFW